MVTQPGVLLTAVFHEGNFALIVGLLAPVVFLPLLAPRYLLPVAPVFALHLAATSAVTSPPGDRLAAPMAFVFLATPFALARLGRMGIERVTVDRRPLTLLITASLVFFCLNGPTSPYRSPWAWGGRDLVDQARVEAALKVDPVEAVRASPTLLGEFAERPRTWALVLHARGQPGGGGRRRPGRRRRRAGPESPCPPGTRGTRPPSAPVSASTDFASATPGRASSSTAGGRDHRQPRAARRRWATSSISASATPWPRSRSAV